MRILLTGVTGQLGHTLQPILSQHHEVIAPTRAQLDLSDAAAIAAFVADCKPDLIINPAAYTAVDKAETEVELAQAINAIAPGVFAEQAKKLGIGLIHYSTDYVYDGSLRDDNGKLPSYTEDAPTNPVNVYGKTKLAGEQAIIASGCKYLIFRTSWVYSTFGKNFLLTMLRLANERDELRVVNDQWGAPTSANAIADISAAIVAQLNSAEDAATWWTSHQGTYHLTTKGRTSWCGFTQEIMRQASAAGRLQKAAPTVTGIPATEYPTPAQRPVNSCLDTSLLATTFHVHIPEWEAALAHVLGKIA
ncbi:dTDP-4-dehydrorhamnose reductase [Undibacterium sp. Dicai25W]|uniref:dTDP-4-dehydrorhamnose reductase n=1 Tax=Undibacterium sp. Dicai25W TaxID=3413034 RepID=UPI003BF02927